MLPTAARRTLALLLLLAAAPTARAQDDPTPPPEADPSAPVVAVEAVETAPETSAVADDAPAETRLPETTVIGSAEEERRLPGSGSYLDEEILRSSGQGDVNRILRRVPGTYVRPEDGFGLFPNISLRGVDTNRSGKLTLMEDGILMAPAPYSAPSAYYSPNVDRMAGLEVLKGSSSIRFGPHTTGGVINYLSTPIPAEPRLFTRFVGGTNRDLRVQTSVGGWFEEEGAGRIGILLEAYWRESDGFKTIRTGRGYPGSRRTGFERTEPMVKVAWEPATSVYHRFEVRWAQSDTTADEGYLGLTERDFDRRPHTRYAGSRFDRFEGDQQRFYARWVFEPTDAWQFTTTWYDNDFDRDWFKLHDVRDGGGTRVSLSRALAENGTHLAVLRGRGPGELRVRHNNRRYGSRGLDLRALWEGETGRFGHEVLLGARFHEDFERRFQWNETYTQDATGRITDRAVGIKGSAGNRRESSRAASFFVQDRVTAGRWAVTPGVRVENVDQDSDDYGAPGPEGRASHHVVVGGVGATFEANADWTFFGGVHQGLSVPGPRGSVNNGVDEERSLGAELGARWHPADGPFAAALTAFRTQFDDLIVTGNIGGAGSGLTENVGSVETRGLEFELQYDLGVARDWCVRNPWFVTGTWTRAVLTSDSNSTDPESLFAGGRSGADVPYVPDLTFTVGTGIEGDAAGLEIAATFTDDTYSTASNTGRQRTPAGVPDARFGRLGDYWIVDVSGWYQLSDAARLVGGIQNLLGEDYMVSRHPHGPRAGMPRFAWLGIELEF